MTTIPDCNEHTPHYKLTYFTLYAYAEPIRLILAHAGVEYEDECLEQDSPEWEARKHTTPNGQLPILEVDGKILNQSKAISTFLAKKYGLDGQNEWESAQIQALIADLDECKMHGRHWYQERNATKRAEIFPVLTRDIIIPWMDRLEKTLKVNGTGYFVGSQLTQADLHLFNGLERWNVAGLVTAALKNHPELVKFIEKVTNLPKIKEWWIDQDHRPRPPPWFMTINQ